jgi:hypothetical protein
VTLWQRVHNPRFAINWAFDLTDCLWTIDEETDLWAIYTGEAPVTLVLGSSSSGRSVNRNVPVARLRWTDRDLVATTAS